jgi:hypothetical protein
LILAKRISDKERKEIVDDFTNNISLEEISKRYNFTKLTISRNLKKSLGEDKFNELNKSNKSNKSNKNEKRNLDSKKLVEMKGDDKNLEGYYKEASNDSFPENTFLEIAPLNLEIDNEPQKDLSSISIEEVELPKVVYMVVDKQVELETKLLKEYIEWNFLSEKDLSRNTIEIFYDLKTAKRSIKKDQRVIKVPNSNVFKIAAPILLSRGISRIVSSEVLIAL